MTVGALESSRSSRAPDGRAEHQTWRTWWTRAGYAPLDGALAPEGPQYWCDGLREDLACADRALAVGDGRTRRALEALHRQLGVDGALTLSYRFADRDVDVPSVGGDP